MKKRLLVAVLLAVALVGLVLPGIAQADEIFHFEGTAAIAEFSSTDGSGCLLTNVFLWGVDRTFQSPPDPGITSSDARISIGVFNVCAGTWLLSAYNPVAPLADSDFQIAPSLNSATLNTTIEVFDFVSGSSFDVGVAITWTGAGDLTHTNDHAHYQLPGFIINNHFIGASRPADASGSVTDGVTNFTPNPAVSAEFLSSTSGEVHIDL